MSTIATYEQDSSAMSRIYVMKAAIDVWKAHPFFGVGMGTQNFLIAAKPFVQDTLGADRTWGAHERIAVRRA